jgi:hypothetical protein
MSDEMARLHHLRAELGIEDLVTFLGKRDQDLLPYYYSAAEVVVMPSHYESFGMVALEAMACGTPVIASRVGGLRFSVVHGYTGLHVPVANADALAAAILKLFKNDALRWHLSANSRKMAQGFGWPTITVQIVELFREAMARGQAQPTGAAHATPQANSGDNVHGNRNDISRPLQAPLIPPCLASSSFPSPCAATWTGAACWPQLQRLATRGHAVAWASGPAVQAPVARAGVELIELQATGWQALPPLPDEPAGQLSSLRCAVGARWTPGSARRRYCRPSPRSSALSQPGGPTRCWSSPMLWPARWLPSGQGCRWWSAAGQRCPAAPALANPAGRRAGELCQLVGVAGAYWDLATGQVRSPLAAHRLLQPPLVRRPAWPSPRRPASWAANQSPVRADRLDPPTVLVTLGSLFNQDPAFFRIAAEALLLEGGQPLVVTGGGRRIRRPACRPASRCKRG